MDFSFTPEQEAFRESLRDFIKRECPPELDRELDEQGRYPWELNDKLAATGLFGLPFGEQYGGSGGGVFDFVIAAEELAYGSAAASALFILPAFFAGEQINLNGSEAQKREYLPQIAKGQLRGCFALTEPDVGSDGASVKTRAVRDGDSWVINGHKTLISGVDIADYIMTVTRTNPDDRYNGITIFMVPRTAPGVTFRRIPKLGNEIIGLFEIFYDDVRVPANMAIGEEAGVNQGWWAMMRSLNLERVMIAAQYTGIAARATDDAIRYAKDRVQFGKPISTYQMVAAMLADMTTGVQTCRLMTYWCAWLLAEGKPAFLEASQAKIHVTETVRQVCLNGLQVMGGYGYTKESDMQRYLRDALLGPIGGGTNQIQRLIIAKALNLF